MARITRNTTYEVELDHEYPQLTIRRYCIDAAGSASIFDTMNLENAHVISSTISCECSRDGGATWQVETYPLLQVNDTFIDCYKIIKYNDDSIEAIYSIDD